MKHFILLLIIIVSASFKTNAQCSATFNYSVLSAGTVSFIATGNNAPGTNYSWAFPSGAILTGSTCVQNFSIGPIYNVTLSVINSANSCTVINSQTVNPQGSSNCTITPSYSFTSNGIGTYTFQNTSPNTSTSNVTWFIDYNNFINGQSAIHTFSANGVYTINLNINDSAGTGCNYNNTSTFTVNNLPCTIQPSFSTNSTLGYVVYGTNIVFINQTSYLGNGATYTLNFGDGTFTNSITAFHSYSTTGIYNVALTAAEGAGSCSATFIHTLNVLPCPTYTGSPTFTINNNGAVSFSSSTTSSNTLTYNWIFGNNGSNTYGNPVNYNYTSNGTYTVTLIITDSLGTSNSTCYTTQTMAISVNNVTCTLNASAYSTISGNGNASFIAYVTYTPSYTSAWYFGDGTQSSNLITTHQYSLNGIYTPTFVVWDNSTPSCSLQIVNSPINIFSVNCPTTITTQHNLGSNGALNATITTALNPTNTVWNFGDGTYSYGNNSISHTYSLNGNYNVLVYVSDSILNCFTFTIIPINITNSSNLGCNANAYFSFYKDISQPFSWWAIPNFQSNVANVLWSWGDGSSSTGLYPSHTYSAAGFYNVCLTVSLSCGSVSTTCNNTYLYRTAQSSNNAFINVSIYNSATVGIKETYNTTELIDIYPNPSSNIINIAVNNELEINKLEVYNILGEKVLSKQNKAQQIDLNDLSKGVYIISINTNKGIVTKKIIKE